MPRPSRTINPLHFSDLSANRFEDLTLALVYRLQQWEDIHHDGRTGADDGVDIRATAAAPDGSLRVWHVQCKRYGRFTAADAKSAVRETLRTAAIPPDVMLLVVGCDVSLAARTAYERTAAEAGIGSAYLWTASKLETMLYADHPDLLFSFFGVSVARRERSRESDLRRTMAMKRKLKRVFPPGRYKPRIVIHSIDDDTYPRSDRPEDGAISPWFRVEFAAHYHAGVEVYLGVEEIRLDQDSETWSGVAHRGREFGAADETAETLDNQRYSAHTVFLVGRIPFRNIFEVDEDGDEFYPEPHFYCRFADQGQPYEEVLRREVNGCREFRAAEHVSVDLRRRREIPPSTSDETVEK
ncbi:restriction endonuclease [Paraburkholderia tropica]|uniref:restriction endonuclease n=1 Tax=Paraburkholderia tropica TaxID=92647 RepID=UPI002AAF785A|nr:restriction endonuclease [Paraburkholderia tropica]